MVSITGAVTPSVSGGLPCPEVHTSGGVQGWGAPPAAQLGYLLLHQLVCGLPPSQAALALLGAHPQLVAGVANANIWLPA